MSDLFMDLQRRRHRCHSHQNYQNTPPTSTSATTATTTSDSPSSTQYNVNDQIFSHHRKDSLAADGGTGHYANYNFNNRKDDTNYKHDVSDDAHDAFENILSLKLKKPKHWKWELSTSKSCSNIALPRILLYDHKGELLVDAQGDKEAVFKQQNHAASQSDRSKKRAHQSKLNRPEYQQRAATVNLTHSIRQALENEFNGLHIQEATPSPQRNSPVSPSSHCGHKAIDLNTNDLPDYGLSRRSSSLRGVRFNIVRGEDEHVTESHIPEFLPTPPSTATPTSSSSGPREKRRHRRSQSSGRSSAHSESILERFSYQRGRFSSPEYVEETQAERAPRYFLRTCRAGTLVIKEDSFYQHPKRRRRPNRNRSTDSLQSVQEIPTVLPLQTRAIPFCSSPTTSDISCNRNQQPSRRHLTERNVSSLHKQLSTSEEDFANCEIPKPVTDNISGKHLRKCKCSPAQNQTKDLDYTADVLHNGKVR